jgi:hypothetical protein
VKVHVKEQGSQALHTISYVERALLQDQNQFLFKVNNDAEARRSASSVVLGRAEVMSFDELEEGRSRRAAKDRGAARTSNAPASLLRAPAARMSRAKVALFASM